LLTKLRLPHPFISTLGTMNVYRGLALIITGASPIFGFSYLMNFTGQANVGFIPVSFILVILICVIFHIFLTRTAKVRYISVICRIYDTGIVFRIPVVKVLVRVYTIIGLRVG